MEQCKIQFRIMNTLLVLICVSDVVLAAIVPGQDCGVQTPIKMVGKLSSTEEMEPCMIVSDRKSFSNVVLKDPKRAGSQQFSAIILLSC